MKSEGIVIPERSEGSFLLRVNIYGGWHNGPKRRLGRICPKQAVSGLERQFTAAVAWLAILPRHRKFTE